MVLRKLVFYGKLPPPLTGMTIANKGILEILSSHFNIEIINYSQGKLRPSGRNLKAFVYNFRQLLISIQLNGKLRSVLQSKEEKVLYFVGSPSFFGNLLDIIRTSWIGKRTSTQVIMHIHTGNWLDNMSSFRLLGGGAKMLSRVDQIIALSDGLKEKFEGHFELDRISVLRNTIDKDLTCSQLEIERKLAKPLETFRILYLSNFILSKGYDLLIQALEKLYTEKSIRHFELVLVGAYPSQAESKVVEHRVGSSVIKDKISLLGPIYDRKKVKEEYLKADVFCLPTFYPLEAQPLSILEAMNAACMVVSTCHASIPEFIESGKNGVLVEKENLQALSTALEFILQKRDRSLGQSARRSFEEAFSEAAQTSKIKEIFGVI